jgi:hypothetical protein
MLELRKLVEYKVNTQKSAAFVHTNNKNMESAMDSKVPFKMPK